MKRRLSDDTGIVVGDWCDDDSDCDDIMYSNCSKKLLVYDSNNASYMCSVNNSRGESLYEMVIM